jgi:glycerol kinase
MLNACINRSDIEEASAMGAVIMNGLARKIWKDMEEVAKLRTSDNRIMPIMEEETREYLYNGWVNAVRTVNKQ